MYLTRIDLMLRQRAIQQALGDCQRLHQMIMGLFESDRKSSGVLYRVREDRYAAALYLYSNRPVNRERLLSGMHFYGQRDLTPWLDAMADGQIWQFDLLASPTKKVGQEGQKTAGGGFCARVRSALPGWRGKARRTASGCCIVRSWRAASYPGGTHQSGADPCTWISTAIRGRSRL